MNPSVTDQQRIKAQLLVWWILWASILTGLGVIYFALVGREPLPVPSAAELSRNLLGFVPLFLSIIVRWLVLPRYTEPQRAFVVFIVGMALADGCGILGIFLGGPYRDALFVLGVLGVFQYVPSFAKKLFEPGARGLLPNN